MSVRHIYLQRQSRQQVGLELLQELIVFVILDDRLAMLVLVWRVDYSQPKDELFSVVVAEDTPDIPAELLVDALGNLSVAELQRFQRRPGE